MSRPRIVVPLRVPPLSTSVFRKGWQSVKREMLVVKHWAANIWTGEENNAVFYLTIDLKVASEDIVSALSGLWIGHGEGAAW